MTKLIPRYSNLVFLACASFLIAGCEKAEKAFQNRNDSSDRSFIRNNLAQLSEAGRVYTFDHNVSVVRFDDVVGPQKFVKKIVPVDGEDYRQFDYSPNTNSWTIITKRGVTVTFERPQRPNQPAQPTTTAVPSPAAQEPRQP